MQLLRSGRALFILQWFLAILLPVFIFLGRGLVGAGLGWMSVVGIVYGPILILLLLVPPLAVLFDGPARKGGTVRRHYATATYVLWGALLVVGLSIPDAGDSGSVPSALMAWTGISDDASELIFIGAGGVAVIAWIAALVAAIVGAVRGRAVAAV